MSGQKNQPSDLQVIGFDLDNTLYPVTDLMQGRIRSKIYEKIAVELGISFQDSSNLFEENYNGNFPWSHSGPKTIKEIGRKYGRQISGSDILHQSLEEADILDFISPNPELNDMLKRLGKKFHVDLITDSRPHLAEKKLKKIGLDASAFGFMLCGNTAGSKSSGGAYIHWLATRGLEPEKALYVGDNEKQDIDVPKSLGIRTCIVGKPYANADYFIGNILDLEKVLQDLQPSY